MLVSEKITPLTVEQKLAGLAPSFSFQPGIPNEVISGLRPGPRGFAPGTILLAHPVHTVGCANTPPLSQGLSASSHARLPGVPQPSLGHPVGFAARLTKVRPRLASLRLTRFSFGKSRQSSLLPQTLWGLRALWETPGSLAVLGACRYAPGGGVSPGNPGLHFAFAKYEGIKSEYQI